MHTKYKIDHTNLKKKKIMVPTPQNGQILIVNKIGFGLTTPHFFKNSQIL